jgi:hypothetical protein
MAKQMLAMTYLALHDRESAKPLMIDVVESVYRDYSRSFPLMNEQESLQFAATGELRLRLFCSYVNDFHDADPELPARMFGLRVTPKVAGQLANNVFLDICRLVGYNFGSSLRLFP